jgi:lipid A 4'-phosphatase
MPFILVLLGVLLGLAALVLFPGGDLWVAGWFFDPAAMRFPLRDAPFMEGAHKVIQYGFRVLAVGLVLALGFTAIRRRPVLGFGAKEWLFLALSLGVGAGLVVNVILKDHWHRARPVQVQEFGGTARFTPPFLISDQCNRNCSFVAGDPSTVLTLSSLAYLVRRRRRAVLAASLLAWGGAGWLRIAMGGHFFSDVVFGGVIVLAVIAALHAWLYGRRQTAAFWKQVVGKAV